ncbi:MAG: hypothetical protein ACK5AZ_04875 [Bryobacteraceae bacterium]
MKERTDLKLLFATSFSDSCYRSIRGVAQLADRWSVDITIAHVMRSGKRTRVEVQRELDSFFAEADHYHGCRRLLLEGNPATVIPALTRRQHYDLVIAPCSDPVGLPRPFHSSLRSRMLSASLAPLWTAGRFIHRVQFRPRLQTIACLINFRDTKLKHLRLAATMAFHAGAELRLLHVIPTIDDGSVNWACLNDDPLHPDAAITRIKEIARDLPEVGGIDVATGDLHREVPKLLSQCGADLLFLGEGMVINSFAGFHRMSKTVSTSPCPVICVDGPSARTPGWTFEMLSAARQEGLLSAYDRVAEKNGLVALTDAR